MSDQNYHADWRAFLGFKLALARVNDATVLEDQLLPSDIYILSIIRYKKNNGVCSFQYIQEQLGYYQHTMPPANIRKSLNKLAGNFCIELIPYKKSSKRNYYRYGISLRGSQILGRLSYQIRLLQDQEKIKR